MYAETKQGRARAEAELARKEPDWAWPRQVGPRRKRQSEAEPSRAEANAAEPDAGRAQPGPSLSHNELFPLLIVRYGAGSSRAKQLCRGFQYNPFTTFDGILTGDG